MERSHLGGSGYHHLVTSIPAWMLGSPRLRVPPWSTSRGGLAPGDSVGHVPTQPPHCRHRGHARGPASRRRSRSQPRGPRRAAGMCHAHGAVSPAFPGPVTPGPLPPPPTSVPAPSVPRPGWHPPPKRGAGSPLPRLARAGEKSVQASWWWSHWGAGGDRAELSTPRWRIPTRCQACERPAAPRRASRPQPCQKTPPVPLTVHRQATGDGRRPSLPDVAGVGGGRSRRGRGSPAPSRAEPAQLMTLMPSCSRGAGVEPLCPTPWVGG